MQKEFQCINHNVFVSKLSDKTKNFEINKLVMIDIDNQLIFDFFQNYFKDLNELKPTELEMKRYLKNSFHFDNFMIL